MELKCRVSNFFFKVVYQLVLKGSLSLHPDNPASAPVSSHSSQMEHFGTVHELYNASKVLSVCISKSHYIHHCG